MKLKDRLNSENRAIWDTLQYRYRNYLETQTKMQGDMTDDEMNTYIKPYLIKIAGRTKPLKKYKKPKKKYDYATLRNKLKAIENYINQVDEMPDYEKLTDKYKVYEAGISAGTIKTKQEIKKILERSY